MKTRSGAPSGGGRPRSRAWGITATYAAFATLWIYFSDQALRLFVPDPEGFVRWSVLKGVVFVGATSLLLLGLMRRAFDTIEDGHASLAVKEREQREHLAEIERLQRLYAALSQVNQAIVRATSRTELFQRVCRVLVEHGRFRMAWVGWRDPDTERIVPVAEWGDDGGYLEQTSVYADDCPEGRGPSGIAFRSGRPYVCNDVLGDPAAALWRGHAARRDIRAAASLPVREGGRVAGLLNVYAAERGFFQAKEMALLEEAASDIEYALDNMAGEEARRAAQDLAWSEAGFSRTMIESMPGILYFYDRSGRFLRWNENFEKVSGYSGEEIARMHPLDFFAADQRSSVEERIREVFETGTSFVEAPFVAKDGSATPYFFTGRRVMFGGQDCLVGMGIDISERTRAEAERRHTERRFRETLDNILEGCQVLDFEWRYTYLNQAAQRHNRRPNGELLGRTMLDAWPGIERSHAFSIIERSMRERVGLHEEVEFTFPDGTSGWFDLRVQPVPEGIFILSIDITERHAAERDLRRLNETLEQKVVERTEELQVALERAEAADRLKSAFLATMSHELRTPLNSIIGFTGIILQELAGPLTAEQAKQLGMVRSSARHLLDLINDVLDLSKIEAGQLEVRPEDFDLRAVIEQALEVVRPMAEAKGLGLDATLADGVATMTSDRRRVEQVLLNLLNNAVKFTSTGRVILTAEAESHRVRLRVRDTGIGIRPEDMDLLFQPFRQVDSGLTRRHEGTGLGLAICRRLVGLLGGEVTVTSEWNVGSEFCVVLPRRIEAA